MPMRLTFRVVLHPLHHTLLTDYDHQRSLLSDLDGVAIFDEGVNLIIENDALPPQTNILTGTPSIMTHNPDCHTEDEGKRKIRFSLNPGCLFGNGWLVVEIY
eukprot:scaffold27129_cov73-Attheya_sp.AAC.2